MIIALPAIAQTTAIPDTQFEQILINEGIDSDGTINGQVLTSDIVGVLNLNLQDVQDLTGLQDFAALESLILDEGGPGSDLTVDLTANTNLKKVEIWSFAGLSKLDLTGLISLEELILHELQGDVITMSIDSLDLSTNTNIKKIDLGVVEYLQTINLQNGNNVNMLNFELYLYQGSPGPFPTPRPMCIKVDDATAATANNPPYDSWIIHDIDPTFYDTGVCTLSTTNVEALAVALHPNPVSEVFRINSQQDIKRINIYDLQGKLVKSYAKPQGNYPVADLAKGMYFVEVQSIENQKQLLKLVKK
jgi:hypothetical protein